MKVRPDEIWFLFPSSDFINRKLEIATCPKCEHLIVRLVGQRITDGKVFEDTLSRKKAIRLMNELRNSIDYTSLDSPKQPKVLYGFRYGENKERINKRTGVTTVIQKAVDFYGNKEKIKEFTGQ